MRCARGEARVVTATCGERAAILLAAPPLTGGTSRHSDALFRPPTMRAQVCELDIMFNLEKAHFILDEMCVDPAARA